MLLTGANTHDSVPLKELVEALPPIAGKVGRPRRRPDRLLGDRAYDSRALRQWLRALGITPLLAKRGTEHGSGLGVWRWVGERTISWFHQFRRLRIRYERRADIHEAFLMIGCIQVCWRFLTESF